MNREIKLNDFKGSWIGADSAGKEYRLRINNEYHAILSKGLATIKGNKIYEGAVNFKINKDHSGYVLNIGEKIFDCVIKTRQGINNFSLDIIEEIKITDPIIDSKPILLKNIKVQ